MSMEKISISQEPFCKHFGNCGGCTGQHLSYDKQLDNKRQLVIDHLQKNGFTLPSSIPIISHIDRHYRNRMDFTFSERGPSLRKKGHFAQLVPIDNCPISNAKLNALLSEVRTWFAKHQEIEPFNHKSRLGTLKYATIRAAEHTNSSSITFILNEDSTKVYAHTEAIKEFAKTTSATTICIGLVPAQTDASLLHDAYPVKGNMNMEEKLLGKTLQFSSQGFFQNNTVMAEKLLAYTRELVEQHKPKHEGKYPPNEILIDLYGGAGTFGITLGDLFTKTVIIDTEGPNIHCAQDNLVQNNIKGEAIVGDAATLSKLNLGSIKTTLLVDPPRSGMHPKVIKKINELKPDTLIYVSCNPMLMAKEIKNFKNYTLTDVAVFDLFPQTVHVEAVVRLQRS